jgi:hypothetical protein
VHEDRVPRSADAPSRPSAGVVEVVGTPVDAIMRLHKQAGNAAVGRLLRPPGDPRGRAILLREPVAPSAPPAPVIATPAEVEQALVVFVTRVQAAMTSGTLTSSPVIRQALYLLRGPGNQLSVGLDVFLSGTTGGPPAEFVRAAMKYLPPAIPKARLEALEKIPSAPSTIAGPATLAQAVGAIVDASIAPLIRKLPIGADLQAKLVEAARSAIADGIIGIADAALDSAAGLDADSKKALHNAIEAGMKQAATRAPAPSGNDANVREQAPSVAPTPTPVEGEDITKGPAVDLPGTPPAYKPQPVPPDPGSPAGSVVERLDDYALFPPNAIGTPLARELTRARPFGRMLAERLDAAQRTKTFVVEIPIASAYAGVQDLQYVFDRAAGIVTTVVGALPHHASFVGQVNVYVEDHPGMRRVVKLR